MAIIKHKAMKNSNYSAAIEYLEYEHDASGKIKKDERGSPVLRDNFLIEGINCEPQSFQNECRRVNEQYKKNLRRDEVKSHSYIISFDPRDAIDNGLTMQEVQKFGVEFATKYLPGYQTIVCTHADGNNGSGNLHCHILINSIRLHNADWEIYMDQPTDHLAGFKHRCTPAFERFMKEKVMEMCQQRGLYQVNLLESPVERITDSEYYLNLRGQSLEGKNYQTKKEYLRCAIRDCAVKSNNLEEFKIILKAEYHIAVHESRGRYSFILPERERGITERQLGTYYTKAFIEKVICREEAYYDRNERKTYRTNDFVGPDVKRLVDLASNIKAQQSKGYKHAIVLSNLKKTAETFNYLSEKGIKKTKALEITLDDIRNRYTEVTKDIKRIEVQIANIQDAISLKKEIERLQPIVKELKTGERSSEYRKKHEADLVIYKAVKEKMGSVNTDLKGFSEKMLEDEKNKLTEIKNVLYEERTQMKKDIKDIENAKKNLELLYSAGEEMNRKERTSDTNRKR